MQASQPFSWDTVRIFLTVAREGSLSGAARALRVSQPTVGRRVKGLEDHLATRLFDRLPDGLALTAAGQELVPMAEAIEQDALAFMRQSARLVDTPSGRLRISTDLSVGRFLGRRIVALQARLPEAEITLDTSDSAADLARMEADLLIRHCLPDSGNLIARSLGITRYAIYATPAYETAIARHNAPPVWIATGADRTNFDDSRLWMEREAGGPPRYLVSNDVSALDLCLAGVGRTILPTFLADGTPGLVQVGAPIDTLDKKRWLMAHRDLARTPLVRAGLDAVIAVFRDGAAS